MKHTVIGMDIAKRVFQLHAVDSKGDCWDNAPTESLRGD